MLRTILIYGVLLAAGAFGLRWLEYQYIARMHATETGRALGAIALGKQLTRATDVLVERPSHIAAQKPAFPRPDGPLLPEK